MPFRVGEQLTTTPRLVGNVSIAGLSTTTVVEKKPSFNSTAYYIVAEGRPLPLIQRIYALYYKMDNARRELQHALAAERALLGGRQRSPHGNDALR